MRCAAQLVLQRRQRHIRQRLKLRSTPLPRARCRSHTAPAPEPPASSLRATADVLGENQRSMGSVQQLKAEQEHEHRGGKRNQRSAQHHPRPQPRSQRTAALVRIELEDVPEQQHQEHHQQQKYQHREPGKGQGLSVGLRIEQSHAVGVKPLQHAQRCEKQQRQPREQGNRTPPWIAPGTACGDYSAIRAKKAEYRNYASESVYFVYSEAFPR